MNWGGGLNIKKHVFILFITTYPKIQQIKPYIFVCAAPRKYI